MNFKNKKAEETVMETVIFIVLNSLFFLSILVFLWRSSSGTAILEETTAKKIALIIDNMQENMEATVDISNLYIEAEKNKFNPDKIFSVDYDKKLIEIAVSSGGSYKYHYFSDFKNLEFKIDSTNKKLTIKT